MEGQNPSSGFEQLAKNVFARVGTVVTGIAAVVTALYQLARDLILTLEGLAIVLAILSSAVVVAWQSSKMVDGKKVSTPSFSKTKRLIAGAVLVAAIGVAIPYGIQIANILIQRDQVEKQLAAAPLLALTPTVTRTATSVPTLTHTPAPAAQLTAVAQSAQATVLARGAWPLALSDSFASNVNGWSLGNFNNELGTMRRTIANGKLTQEVNPTKFLNYSTLYRNPRDFGDFYATAEVRLVSGSPNRNAYGLLFRQQELGNTYFLSVSDERRISASLVADGKVTTLARLDIVPAIKPGEANRLTVVALGSHFDILINDQLVTSFDNNQFKVGKIGFRTDHAVIGESSVIEFSNFQIRAP